MITNKILLLSFLSCIFLIGMEEEDISRKTVIIPNSWYAMTYKQLQKENSHLSHELEHARGVFLAELHDKYTNAWEAINELQSKYPFRVWVTRNYDFFREHENTFLVKNLKKMRFEDIEDLEKRVERLKQTINY